MAVYDALVIGAGPAGSSAAAALAARGQRVLLVEQDRLPRHKVCGEFLSPEAQHTLDALGLTAAIMAHGPHPLTHMQVTAPGGQTLRRPLPAAAWGISRYVLDATLAQAAAAQGATLLTATTATRTQHRGEVYVVSLRRAGRQSVGHQVTVAARIVLLAAGRQSRAALCPQPPPPADHAAGTLRRAVGIKRHLCGLSMDDQVELYLFAGGYAGINPVEGERANLCLLVEEGTLRTAGGQVESVIAAAGAANPALAARLADARPVAGTTCTVAAVDTQTPARLWSGLPRLGDAALMLPPLCGDGMAMALRGAELCAAGAAAYLRGDCTLAEWEAAYTAAWRREFEGRVRLAHTVQGLLLKPGLAGALLALGARLPWAADYVVRATRGSVGNPSPLPTSESG